jgi:hypothetical protein
MLISHSKKFIFIHIYKTAGSSIESLLSKYSTFRHSRKDRLRRLIYRWPNVYSDDFHRHLDATELSERIDQKIYSGYYKLCFVRNPFDWLVSLYFYIQQHPEHHQHGIVSSMNDLSTFLDWRIDIGARTQCSFVFNERGEQLVDFIGRCEALDQEFRKVTEAIHIPYSPVPVVNASKRKPAHFYYSPEMEKKVVNYFVDDFDRFGYSKFLERR